MKHRILLVDDEEHLRKMMRLTLETAGYEVGEAADGAEALEAFGNGGIWSAVLLDQRMPGMNGLETLRRVLSIRPDKPVIMVTAYASIELAVDAMKLGASDFLRKPMTPESLRNAVRAVLAFSHGRASAVSPPSAESRRARVESLTMNGFRFVRAKDAKPDSVEQPNERRFLVSMPDASQREVLVLIDDEAFARVERMTHRRLPYESSYWTSRATRLLAQYLWDEGRLPFTPLHITDADRDEIEIAARWSER